MWDGDRQGDFTTIVRDPGDPRFLYLTGQVGLYSCGVWGLWMMQVGALCTLNPRNCA